MLCSSNETNFLFENMFGSHPDGLYAVWDNHVLFLNEKARELIGASFDGTVQKSACFTDLFADPDSADVFARVHDQLATDKNQRYRWSQLIKKNNSDTVWVEVEARRLDALKHPFIYGLVQDVTSEKLKYDAKSISMQTLQLVLDAMEDMIYVVTDDYRVVYCNRLMLQSLSHFDQTLDYRQYPCYELFHCRSSPCVDCRNKDVFFSTHPLYREVGSKDMQGCFFVIELAIKLPNVNQPAKIVITRDVTIWKKAENRMHKLAQFLLKAQERERRRLSGQLENDLARHIMGIKDALEGLSRTMPNGSNLRQRSEWVNHLLDKSTDSLQELMSGLRPASLERVGLEETIRDYCNLFSMSSGIEVDFMANNIEAGKITDALAINLFRIIQESLHNVLKHAEASSVTIRIFTNGRELDLLIEDNGKGFFMERFLSGDRDNTHLGLVGMMERANLFGGDFQVYSTPGKGTKIEVRADLRIGSDKQD